MHAGGVPMQRRAVGAIGAEAYAVHRRRARPLGAAPSGSGLDDHAAGPLGEHGLQRPAEQRRRRRAAAAAA